MSKSTVPIPLTEDELVDFWRVLMAARQAEARGEFDEPYSTDIRRIELRVGFGRATLNGDEAAYSTFAEFMLCRFGPSGGDRGIGWAGDALERMMVRDGSWARSRGDVRVWNRFSGGAA